MEKLAIVIVTYKRTQLLDKLLDSLLYSTRPPWRVFIIDNDAAADAAATVEIYERLVDEGCTQVPWPEGKGTFCYVAMPNNTGGAGGFAEGVKRAYAEGAQWFWLMDDDVKVFPDSIEKLDRWTGRFDVVQGSRLDCDGGPFYWQYRFIESLGMYNPLAPSKPTREGFRPTNAMCFEGALFNRDVVCRLGPPDARFFIYWDDCVYGYLASQAFRTAMVDDVVLQRTREVNNWEVTGVRQLNSASNMTRYHIMRNRGYMAHYLAQHKKFNPALFGVGTVLVAAKEIVRLLSVDRVDLKSGCASLIDGWRDARKIMRDDTWTPTGPGDLNADTP